MTGGAHRRQARLQGAHLGGRGAQLRRRSSVAADAAAGRQDRRRHQGQGEVSRRAAGGGDGLCAPRRRRPRRRRSRRWRRRRRRRSRSSRRTRERLEVAKKCGKDVTCYATVLDERCEADAPGEGGLHAGAPGQDGAAGAAQEAEHARAGRALRGAVRHRQDRRQVVTPRRSRRSTRRSRSIAPSRRCARSSRRCARCVPRSIPSHSIRSSMLSRPSKIWRARRRSVARLRRRPVRPAQARARPGAPRAAPARRHAQELQAQRLLHPARVRRLPRRRAGAALFSLSTVHRLFWPLFVVGNVLAIVQAAWLFVARAARQSRARFIAQQRPARLLVRRRAQPRSVGRRPQDVRLRPVADRALGAQPVVRRRAVGDARPPDDAHVLYQAFFTLYVFNYFQFEYGMLHTWDVIAENFGFMLVWGDTPFVPFFYSIGGWFVLRNHGAAAGLPGGGAVSAVRRRVVAVSRRQSAEAPVQGRSDRARSGDARPRPSAASCWSRASGASGASSTTPAS